MIRLVTAIGLLVLLVVWAVPVGERILPPQGTPPPSPPPPPGSSRPLPCAPNAPCCPTAVAQLSGPPCRVGCPGPPPKKLVDANPDLAEVARPYPTSVVILELVINEKGVPVSSCVLRGVRADFDKAAQLATLAWRFEPKVVDGKPIGVVLTVTVKAPGNDG